MARGESVPFRRLALAVMTAGVLGALSSLGGCGSSSEQPTKTTNAGGDAGDVVDAGFDPDDPNSGDVDPGGPIAAQMNDVSIMFPLPQTAADIASLLAPSVVGSRGTLVPSSLYTTVAELPGSTLTTTAPSNGLAGYSIASYDDLRVVSVRIDPCFAVMHPDPHGAACPPQVRLVFQEVRAIDGGAPQAFDSALHAIYSLPRNELLTLARKLVALRKANDAANTSAGSLGPHPVIVQQGLAGGMSAGVQKLILQYVGEENLVRVAMFGTDDQLNWIFRANDLPDGGADAIADAGAATTTPFVIPNETLGDPHLQTITSASRPPDVPPLGAFALGWFFQPMISSPDDIEPLGGANQSPTTQMSSDAFTALLRLEDPTQRTFDTTDCGSCHLSTPLAKLVALPEGNDDTTTATSGKDAGFVPDGKSVTAADMAVMYDLTLPRIDLHAFSYDITSPTVNRRVVNETAAIVEYLSALP
jgi:hypothetical protein